MEFAGPLGIRFLLRLALLLRIFITPILIVTTISGILRPRLIQDPFAHGTSEPSSARVLAQG